MNGASLQVLHNEFALQTLFMNTCLCELFLIVNLLREILSRAAFGTNVLEANGHKIIWLTTCKHFRAPIILFTSVALPEWGRLVSVLISGMAVRSSISIRTRISTMVGPPGAAEGGSRI